MIPSDLGDLVIYQLRHYWQDIDEVVIHTAIPETIYEIEENFKNNINKRYYSENEVQFSPYISVQYMIFLYRLSHTIYKQTKNAKEADQVYYLNKIMHAVDWFYAVNLPKHFLCEHPLGSVLGRASYGDYLFVYQGTTIGGNRSHGQLYYPVIGNNVILYANSTVLGDTHIGSNVVISADTYLINEKIPNNCIVFGKTPNIKIKLKSESEIKEYTQHIWGWE